jgi:hypothetical protein
MSFPGCLDEMYKYLDGFFAFHLQQQNVTIKNNFDCLNLFCDSVIFVIIIQYIAAFYCLNFEYST